MRMHHRWLRVAVATVIVSVSSTALATTAMGAPSTRPEDASATTELPYELSEGVTTPIYDYAGAIRESVWVRAPDLDGDGTPERIAADIIRPRELDGNGEVPIVMDASPYYACCGRGNESELKEYDENGRPTQFPLFYDNYFVPRGYAYVAVDMAGTGRSTACTDMGGPADILSVKAVVDWLNGNGTAMDSVGNAVEPYWTNGRTGMIGKSYDGTLANGVAALGTEGLETIVPIGAISSWYDYTRAQGLPFSYNYPTYLSSYVARDRSVPVDCSEQLAQLAAEDGDETGAHTAFWDLRDYREGTMADVSQVKASVFVVHGLQDTNVDTPNFSRWWEALGEHGVERKMWLTRVGHADPFDSNRGEWVSTLHRWFDHELWDIPNGVDREPAVSVEVEPGQWTQQRAWPVREHAAKLRLSAEGGLTLGQAGQDTATWINSTTQRETRAVASEDNANRLLFTTGTLLQDVRLTGTPEITLAVTHGAPTGQIGVALVDYGEAERVLARGDGVRNLENESCWGASNEHEDACYLDVEQRLGQTELQVLSRGWARLDGAGTHNVTVEMTSNDVVVPAGHQLGLVVVGAYPGWVVTVDDAATEYGLDLGATTLSLPVDGAMSSFAADRGKVPAAEDISEGAIPANPKPFRVPR
jgi:X-Pro dipeptidyl-peptidase